jgi:hypothetical protein
MTTLENIENLTEDIAKGTQKNAQDISDLRINMGGKIDEMEHTMSSFIGRVNRQQAVAQDSQALYHSVRAALGRDNNGPAPYFHGTPNELTVPLAEFTQPQAALTPGNFEDVRIRGGYSPLRVSRILSHPAVENHAMIVQMPDDSGVLRVPIMEGGTATWVGENTDFSELGETSAVVDLSGKRLGAYCKIPSDAVDYGDATRVNSLLRTTLATSLSELLDKTFAAHTAVTNGPVGMTGTTALATTGANGDAISRAGLEKMMVKLEASNYMPTVWIMSPAAARKLNETPAFTGAQYPLLQFSNGGARLLDVPVCISNGVPRTNTKGTNSNLETVWLIDARHLIVGYWTRVNIRFVEIEDDALKGRLTAIVRARIDFDLARTGSATRTDTFII